MLALEAEVQRSPRSVDAWRLLGTVHAENDDDTQVSAKSKHTHIEAVFGRLVGFEPMSPESQAVIFQSKFDTAM